ncbi:MAG: hypothetical protein IT243_02605 [Bacteroidia bacterium]|nr:hypothetical protein [Bacteroidia bacterium]
MNTKICLHCQKSFVGRSDKKYCSLSCKNNYSNAKVRLPTELICKINKRLRNNYKILYKLYNGKVRRVLEVEMKQAGFDFNYFTQDYTNNRGERYRYCYNLGYLKLDEKQFLIVKSMQSF